MIVNSIIAGTLIACAVTLVLRFLPRRILNAATRYAIWWLTLGIVIALPFIRVPSLSIPHHGTSNSTTLYVPPMTDFPSADQSPEEDAPATSAVVPVRRPFIAVPASQNWWPRTLLWACGVLAGIMLLRLAASCVLLGRTKARALPADASQSLRVERWLALCGSRRRNIKLKISTAISCPVAVGPFRPAILVPPAFFMELSEEEIDQAGLHETAHLARRDDYALLLQRVFEALLPWHPAVRWISRQIDLEREIACDDFVVEALHQPRSYAACLTHLAELAVRQRPSLLAAGAITKGSHLTRRVELLLDRTRYTGTRLLRFRLAGVALIPLMLALCAARIPELIAFAKPTPAPQATPGPAPIPAPPPAAAPVAANTEDPTVEQWIKANAIPLTTVEAGHGFADMQPLKKIVGNARIVALGEATHGSREFFQMKHRMVEFLVSQMGFTIFSIEANMPEAYRLNDFVLNGKGDPVQLLKGMYFWTWNTEEVLEMIMWMREFNLSGRGRIEFTGFDMQTPDVAAKIVREFAGKNDPGFLPEIEKAPSVRGDVANGAASDTGNFPPADAAGKTVRFSANIKTEDVTGYASIWWRADGIKGGEMKALAFQNLRVAPKGTTSWKHYELEIAVPAEASNINFGVQLIGGGTAWFDGLAVEVDGKPYTQAQGFDLIHRGRILPKGSFPTAPGYAATFDTNESSGAPGPALELKRTAAMPTTQPKQASARWHAIVDHMEASRADWLAKGASAQDTDWAIQNARIVLQSYQMQAQELNRDRAMADNIKWILDHSPPNSKIVLWAHNGHVGTRTEGGFKQMGAELRALYGDQMVVFGFAFDQGSFQAFESTKGVHNFTVPPAPAGSFDSTLAGGGIPLFALDLRHAPDALNTPFKARSIGAVYSDDRADQFFMSIVPKATYDAILFVEHTTAAVPNLSSSARLPQDRGDREYLESLVHKRTTAAEFWRSLQTAAQSSPRKETVDWLRTRLVAKAVNGRAKAVIASYRLHKGSCYTHTVGDRLALSCIGEFEDQSGALLAERVTLVQDQPERLFRSSPIPRSDRYTDRFDGLIEMPQFP